MTNKKGRLNRVVCNSKTIEKKPQKEEYYKKLRATLTSQPSVWRRPDDRPVCSEAHCGCLSVAPRNQKQNLLQSIFTGINDVSL